MTLERFKSLPERLLELAALVLLLLAAVPLASSSSKYACDYSNRLCQWTPSYVFGATVMGDLAFFNGGILSNDATTPVNGSAFQVLDLRTMSPLVIQVEDSKELMSSRYRHQLVVWKGRILAVGGQLDDSNGASQKILNVIELDLNTRKWQLRKQFTQPGGSVDIVFEASVVVDDQLLIVFTSLPPSDAFEPPMRKFASLNLNTRDIDFNFNLAVGPVEVLDWPLIGVMTLGKHGDFPHLVVQSKRQLPKVKAGETVWYEVTNIGEYGFEGPLDFTATTHFKELPGGDGGKVLSLTILQVLDQPTLMTWTVTTANFAGGRRETVNAISMYDVTVAKDAKGKHNIALKHSKLFLTLPFTMSDFKSLQSVDLPWHGNVAVSAADVIALPYVGKVDFIGELDSSNVNIQNWPNRGFIVRGSSLPDPFCQPIATWQPFVLTVDLKSSASASSPVVRAVSNSTWCSSRQAQQVASAVVGNAAAIEANTKLYTVDTEAGPMLTVMSAQRTTNPGGQLPFTNPKLPLQGVFISAANSSVQNFSIPTAPGYQFPIGFASCMSNLAGTSMYLEHGGWYYDGAGTPKTQAGFVAVPMQLGKPVQPMLKVGGAKPANGAVFSSLACTPDGSVYRFGGLQIQRYDKQSVDYDDDGKTDVFMSIPVWAATNQLQVAKLGGSLAAPTLSQLQQLGPAASTNSSASNPNVPNPRSGHTLTYLPPESVASLPGLSKGGLLLYGGSNFSDPSMSTTLNNVTITMKALSNVTFDRTAWLFDLATSKWLKLVPDGVSDAPPGLIYHSAAVQGKQLMVWGGLRFVPENKTMKLCTDMYILDFSEPTPRWRKAHVDNINVQGAFQLAFPNTGIAALPESGVVALMHRSGISLTAVPQTLQPSGPTMLPNWGVYTLNLTAGDWVRLEVPSGPGLTVQQPLLIGSDIILTGVDTAAAAAAGGVGRGLLQQRGEALPVLKCGKNAASAVSIQSAGAALEGLVITGCNGSAVNISIDATGAYTLPATLRNLQIVSNNGSRGAAICIGPAAAAVLENCTISGNNATESSVYAQTGSQLSIVNSTVADNQGSGVVFAGNAMNVTGSNFIRNIAVPAVSTIVASGKPAAAAAGGSVSGGALQIICVSQPGLQGQQGCNSVSAIVNSSFVANRAQDRGGAVYLGNGTFARVERSNFSSNAAADGAAILADRDACLYNMSVVRFRDNSAVGRGGAVLMQGAGCREDMSWDQAIFFNNTAGSDGGAMYLSEMIARNITGQAAFNNNTVTGRKPLVPVASIPGIGNGGALYLGLWNSNVTLVNTAFVGNNVTGSGGAVEVLSIESNVTIINSTALGNYAGVALTTPQTISQAAKSEGGAVHMQGSVGQLALLNVNMTGNMAGRGGAVSVNSELGSFTSVNSSFINNVALTAGGAVAVTERKTVLISDSTFQGNHLWWPQISAGGGLYCYLSERVIIKGSRFSSNKASYGGGAAILQASGPSSITDTDFSSNVALPAPLEYNSPTQRRRSLLKAADRQGFAGHPASDPKALAHVPADILGPIAGNTTADSGFYTGGGGLYVSVTGRVDLNGSCFSDNFAWNGGGLVVRTDACPVTSSTGQPCQLIMSRVSISDRNLAKAGGGLLVTDINPKWIQFADCPTGKALNLNTTFSCLQQANHTCHASSRSGRALLQADPAADPVSAVEAPVASASGDFIATSAANMSCLSIVNFTDGVKWVAENCSDPVRVAPGIPIGVAVQLYDGLGRPVANGTYDERMPMEARLIDPVNATRPKFLLIGNTTQAVAGLASWPGLTINAKPSGDYRLVFKTQNNITVARQLVIRQCQAGEHTSVQPISSELNYTCQQCTSPQYSFYPEASTCGQCSNLGDNSYAVCNLAAVVPQNGFYQSHPRNPLLHRCITAAACSRTDKVKNEMRDWALKHADMTITELNKPSNVTGPYQGKPNYQEYVDMMCNEGYWGPLCGACQDGYGHSTQRCIKCMKRSTNSFVYFLVCLFMFLIPALQTLLHSKNVTKRHGELQRIGTGVASGRHRVLYGQQESIKRGSKRGWVPESLPEETESPEVAADKNIQLVQIDQGSISPVNGGAASDTKHVAHPDQSDVVLSLTPYMSGVVSPQSLASAQQQYPGGLSFVDGSISSKVAPSQVSADSGASVGPFGGVGATPEELRQGSSEQSLPIPPSIAAAVAGSQPVPVSAQRKPSGLLASWFSTEPIDSATINPWAVTAVPSTTAPATAFRSAAQPPAGLVGGGMVPPAGDGMVKKPKFYHTDVLTMLVSYMQLLGLLRLIRLNWSEWLKAVLNTLTYLDFTSGTSTWVSLECSFGDAGLLPKSLRRSLVLLLWPVGALLFLAVIWYLYALFSIRRRGITHGVRRQMRRLEPYMVLSAVTMLYFLYTPTSREIISLFSCQPVDTVEELHRVAPESVYTPDAAFALIDNATDSGWPGVWTSDTSVRCASREHLGIAIGLGIPGLLVWVFGLPIVLWIMLKRNTKIDQFGHPRLEDPVVELKYGLMYDKYRPKRYYWECVVLLENCAMTMLLVMLQAQPATLQILVAMAVMFIGVVLHITFKPYVVKMLDTLRRLAVFALMSTLFFMMLVSMSEFEETPGLPMAALLVIVIINLSVLLVHAWAVWLELRRWILFELGITDREYLTWADIKCMTQRLMHAAFGGKLEEMVRKFSGTAGVPDADAVRAGPDQRGRLGGARRSPPQEFASGGGGVVNTV